jgi:cysteine-S-conjugate beta-lyase
LTAEELARISDICTKNNVILCSDEIHCDLILDAEAQHLPAGKLEQLQGHAITLMAASKTFNIAGLGASFAIIEDSKLRQQFSAAAQGIVPWVNVLGLTATEAAFNECDEWHQQLLGYLRLNRDYLYKEINQIDGLNMLLPQATFLAWVDGNQLEVGSVQHYFESKGLGPSPGADFGDKSFIRINFGCPLAQLKEAIERLKA